MILKKKGGVGQGKSYVHTSILVDTGLYAMVRPPQYTAGILLSLALVLISQKLWIVTVVGLVCLTLMYWDIVNADRHEILKFGDEYKWYMKKVPTNQFPAGINADLKKQIADLKERV